MKLVDHYARRNDEVVTHEESRRKLYRKERKKERKKGKKDRLTER
jgi:hypothetical protein